MRTQSENMSNKLREVQESAIAFCLASDWLRRWDKFSGPIKVQSTILNYFCHFVKIAPLKQDGVFCTMKYK